MNRKINLLLLVGSLLAIQGRAAEPLHESKTLGVRFQIPPAFVIAQPAELPDEQAMVREFARRGVEYKPPFREESLIEQRWAAGQDLKALPRDIPQLALKRKQGSDAETFPIRLAMKDEFRQKIGAWEAYVPPGIPVAPFEDRLFYFVVPLKDGAFLEIMAHKTDAQGNPTHYDQVARKLIESLEMVEK